MSASKVHTVRGEVEPDDLGLTLPHEHLLVRIIDGWFVQPRNEIEEHFASQPMSLEILPMVARRAWSNRDNCRVEDFESVLREVEGFARAGGGALVDLTLDAIGRNPRRAQEISTRTGIHVIAGCGYYVQHTHPAEIASLAIEEIAEHLAAELLEGVGDTGIKPGVIGEIGTGSPLAAGEIKILKAAALVHSQTGAPMSVHLFPAGGTGHQVLDILEQAGVDLSKVALGHLDGQDPINVDEHLELVRRGALVEYDMFGSNWASDDLRDYYADEFYWSPPPSDQQRVRAVATLLEAGFGRQILISHDVCSKIQEACWGGPGFVHIPLYMVPFFRANGFTEAEVDDLVRVNPQAWLTWAH